MHSTVSVFGIPARSVRRGGTRVRLRAPAAAYSAGRPGSLAALPARALRDSLRQGSVLKDFVCFLLFSLCCFANRPLSAAPTPPGVATPAPTPSLRSLGEADLHFIDAPIPVV